MIKKIDQTTPERRFASSTIEIRQTAVDDGVLATIRGHASVFDQISENLGWFREIISPGAFDSVLGDDVRALFNHDPNRILGRTSANTARIGVDELGLWYEADLADTSANRELVTAIERGDVSQSSFGFRVAFRGDEWDENEDGVFIRTITKISNLYDVSPVTFPAYPQTDVARRSFDTWGGDKRAMSTRIAHRRREQCLADLS